MKTVTCREGLTVTMVAEGETEDDVMKRGAEHRYA